MQILKNTDFDFMRHRRAAMTLSALLMAVAVVSLALRGLSFGVDVTGGTVIELGYPQPVELAPLRGHLDAAGFADVQMQHFGTARDVLIRVAPDAGVSQSELSNRIFAALQEHEDGVTLRRVEFVGPQVGEELREDGGFAMLYALLGILIYVAFRFEHRFALGSIIALAHDVLITIGFFSVTGAEFDLAVLAAILAVIGYSLNDTIVVFDRIRENFIKLKSDTVVTINKSVNHTLGRTLMTSLTTMLVLLALLVFGGEVIRGFTIALMVGVVVGTYSSIYVAGTAILMLGVTRENVIPPKKEGANLGGP